MGFLFLRIIESEMSESGSDGILEKVADLFKKTLLENYKIDFKTVSVNFNDLLDVE